MTRIKSSIPEEKKKIIKDKLNNMVTDEMATRLATSILKHSIK